MHLEDVREAWVLYEAAEMHPTSEDIVTQSFEPFILQAASPNLSL